MSLKLNNYETETLVKAIEYVIATNKKENIKDVYELANALQGGAKAAQGNRGKAKNINYRTIINVLHNFINNMERVEEELAILELSDVYMVMNLGIKGEAEIYLPYLGEAKKLKERLYKELQVQN